MNLNRRKSIGIPYQALVDDLFQQFEIVYYEDIWESTVMSELL